MSIPTNSTGIIISNTYLTSISTSKPSCGSGFDWVLVPKFQSIDYSGTPVPSEYQYQPINADNSVWVQIQLDGESGPTISTYASSSPNQTTQTKVFKFPSGQAFFLNSDETNDLQIVGTSLNKSNSQLIGFFQTTGYSANFQNQTNPNPTSAQFVVPDPNNNIVADCDKQEALDNFLNFYGLPFSPDHLSPQEYINYIVTSYALLVQRGEIVLPKVPLPDIKVDNEIVNKIKCLCKKNKKSSFDYCSHRH